MPRLIKKDSTDIALYFFITDSTAFTPETGIDVTTLDIQYVRTLTAPSAKVDAIVSDADLTTHVDDKIVEVDATDQAGLHMVCFRDAAFATGVPGVVLSVTGAGFHPVHEEVQLVDFDPEDATSLGLTSIPLIKAITDRQAKFMIPGAVVAGTLTTTKMSTDLTPTITDQYTNRTLTFLDDTVSAGLQGLQTYITVTDTNGDVTFTAIPIIPAAGDTFEIT